MADDAATFLGYERPDGSYGVRNHVLVLSILGLTSASARRIARLVRGTRCVTTPYGRGLIGADADLHRRTLTGLGRHPNVAAVLVVGADRKAVDRVAGEIAASGKPVEALALDDVHEDALALTDRGVRACVPLARDASRLRRVPAPLAALFCGLECGHSDTTSGLVANPLAGLVVDRLVEAGGRAVFGETVEWLGAEHLLAGRAATPEVGQAIRAAVARREALAVAAGLDLTGNNPGAENIAGGLSTIEEKSLGGISKGGRAPIRGLLGFAEPPREPGLYVMDGPAFSPESMTGMVSAGAQLMLFTTGPGNSVVSGLAPTIKISANPQASHRLAEQIDFDASAAFLGQEGLPAAAGQLFRLVLEVASGGLTLGEILDEGEEVVTRLQPSL
ncbi:MAG TPA: UxaA family hydrolase [Methylomirabilota bacterium]|nr:UxaA family hydrolase [Methylomirabilota bacterium]